MRYYIEWGRGDSKGNVTAVTESFDTEEEQTTRWEALGKHRWCAWARTYTD